VLFRSLNLKSKIGSGAFSRLKNRANKSGATSTIYPEEYAENPTPIAGISEIVNYTREKGLALEPVLYMAALRILESSEELGGIFNGGVLRLASCSKWARHSVKTVMLDWGASFIGDISVSQYHAIYEMLKPCEVDDYLGLLYQSLCKEGNKSDRGSYYTPSKLVDDSLCQIDNPIETFLDPCCGTGKYLVHAAKAFNLRPENVFGFDCDPIATHIAKINLLLAYRSKEFTPNIHCLDSLSELATGDLFCRTNELLGKLDAIATNPPWGAYKNKSSKKRISTSIKSGETFSLFLERSIQLLRQGGQLSFILPESILKVRTHADIRRLILKETKIKKITMLGRQFTGVFTPVIRLDLVKGSAPKTWLVSVEHPVKHDGIRQERFKANDSLMFDIAIRSNDEELLGKIYSIDHSTLCNNADWALGIVTGNNKKHLFYAPMDGAEPVLKGSDILRYKIGQPGSYLRFTPHLFQQVAPERFYRASEKLVYRFISKKLVFAYDNKQRLTLNSANILIPHIPGISIKAALAFLNSSIFQYIFAKKFSTHKVLRRDLERLPFPVIDLKTRNVIETLVEEALISGGSATKLEDLVYRIFQLSDKEICVIKRSLSE